MKPIGFRNVDCGLRNTAICKSLRINILQNQYSEIRNPQSEIVLFAAAHD
jgi:hypothetical protein